MSPVGLISQVKARSPLCRFGYLVRVLDLQGDSALAKTRISRTDLIWIFREKLSSFDDCPPEIPIAIVPSSGGWKAVTAARDRTGRPDCIRRIEQIQRQLREIYVLAKD
jgi:hypothetical protein